ncbi:transcriptional regulator, partial [Salmonella enterica]|nr:transcriptional regulator [Salmonella enterica]
DYVETYLRNRLKNSTQPPEN